MKRGLVSVILPVFNANPDFLKESIESILSQTYNEIELIVVFDYCNPHVDYSTFMILEQFKDDHRLRLVINKSRLGLTRSLNKGIRLARGEFLGRMDCDDISLPTRIEEQVSLLSRRRFDLVGCWSNVIDEDGKVLGYLSPPFEWSTIKKYLLLHNPFLHSSILFTYHLIKTIGVYNQNFEPSEDYELYLRAFSRGFQGTNIPKYLHSLREYSLSMIHGKQWVKNRFAYFKCKFVGFFKYGFNKPLDFVFLGIAPFSILIKPSYGLLFKQLLGLYKRGVMP